MAGPDAPPPPDQDSNSGASCDDGEAVSSPDDDAAHSNNAIETGDNPKKRKRDKYQKTSCELCKARKVKCDRAEPACSWCARHNRTCIYLERQRPGSRIGFGLELEAKVNRIDALLQSLGRRLEDHIDAHPPPPGPASSPSVLTDAAQSSVVAAATGARGGGPPGSAAPALVPALAAAGTAAGGGGSGSGSGGAHSVGTPSSQATTTNAYPGTTAYWAAATDAADTPQYGSAPQPPASTTLSKASPFVHPGQPTSSPGTGSLMGSIGMAGPLPPPVPSLPPPLTGLPPQDVVYTLVDLYFKHCNTWCPILDRKTTFGVFFGATSMTEAERILLHAIVATTLRFLRDTRLSRDAKIHYHSVSRRAVLQYAMDRVSIDALKALVILCLDELGNSNGPRSWNLISMLAQNARQLGLCSEGSVYLVTDHEDPLRIGSVPRISAGRPDSWIEDEGRRRLCWMVYLLDRYTTVSTASFDFCLEERLMNRLLPCSYDLFSKNVPVETQVLSPMTANEGSRNGGGGGGRNGRNSNTHPTPSYIINRPENMGSFSYHCEILRLISRIHNLLWTPLDVTSGPDMAAWRATYRILDTSLDAWLQSLPSEYSKISSLCHSDPASRVANWFMLHSAYVVAVVRLHSAAAYPTVRSHVFVPSHYAMQRCLSAVQSLGDIARDVYEADGLDLLGPPFAFSLWVAARLLIVHAATVGGPVDPKIDFLIQTLHHVGQYWELAGNYAKILTRVVRRGSQNPMSYAAMRKRAQEMVAKTSQTRRSGIDQTSTMVASLDDVDDIDVFDFFNLPRASYGENSDAAQARSLLVPAGTSVTNDANGSSVVNGGAAGLPDPEVDWLRFGTPAFSGV
ncbi:Fungal specific transcription factor domain [Geosmithia morbida]|uniref:Fungal specific transcription factor domain n=1 Tax=Geosmithia morbida TaxID=1094350 RepID=A0A9P4YSP4_9HYPO|nr:Fungal specific transcription factor domain [Geosmithia morbida]KAF4122070.1 Fungal specific transcription factor domain [Geosmithia morbida]